MLGAEPQQFLPIHMMVVDHGTGCCQNGDHGSHDAQWTPEFVLALLEGNGGADTIAKQKMSTYTL